MLEENWVAALVGSKTPMPNARSSMTSTSVMASTGVPRTIRIEAA